MDFTEDPFKNYRYEDPFNIEDPFADAGSAPDPFGRPTSVVGFEADKFFADAPLNGAKEKRGGRVSAPPLTRDPFASADAPDWPAWPADDWAANDSWARPTNDAWPAGNENATGAWPDDTDSWGAKDARRNRTDNWAADWNTDRNRNLNETWPSNTLPAKKEKSPKPVKYAKSLVHTIGGIGRAKQKDKKAKAQLEARSAEALPTEEQQWAWAASESRRLEEEAEKRRRQEDAELQLALAISRQDK